jgi:hypothetical protein
VTVAVTITVPGTVAVSGPLAIIAMPRGAMLPVTVTVLATTVAILAAFARAHLSLPAAAFLVAIFVPVAPLTMAGAVARAVALPRAMRAVRAGAIPRAAAARASVSAATAAGLFGDLPDLRGGVAVVAAVGLVRAPLEVALLGNAHRDLLRLGAVADRLHDDGAVQGLDGSLGRGHIGERAKPEAAGRPVALAPLDLAPRRRGRGLGDDEVVELGVVEGVRESADEEHDLAGSRGDGGGGGGGHTLERRRR